MEEYRKAQTRAMKITVGVLAGLALFEIAPPAVEAFLVWAGRNPDKVEQIAQEAVQTSSGNPTPAASSAPSATAQQLWTERGQIAKLITKEDTKLLGQFFGQGKRGALKELKEFYIPAGLTRETLERYAEIARRAINAGQDKSGVQADRLALIERALNEVTR